MKYRKHHNNKGLRTLRTGKTVQQVRRIARRLGIPYGTIRPSDRNYDNDAR